MFLIETGIKRARGLITTSISLINNVTEHCRRCSLTLEYNKRKKNLKNTLLKRIVCRYEKCYSFNIQIKCVFLNPVENNENGTKFICYLSYNNFWPKLLGFIQIIKHIYSTHVKFYHHKNQ